MKSKIDLLEKYKSNEDYYIYGDFILSMGFMYLDMFENKKGKRELLRYYKYVNIIKNEDLPCFGLKILEDLKFYVLTTDDTYDIEDIKKKRHRTKHLYGGHYILIIDKEKKEGQIVDLRIEKTWFFEKNEEKERKEIEYINQLIGICRKKGVKEVYLYDNYNIHYDNYMYNFSDIYSYYNPENKTWYEKKFNFINQNEYDEEYLSKEDYEKTMINREDLKKTHNYNQKNNGRFVYYVKD